MKLTVLFLLTGLLAICAESYSQAQRINLNMKDAQIVDVFNALEQQSGFYFFYKNDELNVKEKVDAQFQDATIDHILSRLLQGKGLSYKIVDRYIVISPDAAKIINKQQGAKKVQGKITDTSGAPLPGVTVQIKGITQGTVTDTNGDYNLPNVPDHAVLVFSFVGMKTQEIPAAGRTTIHVTMEEEAIGIEEVVAIGYGTMKRKDLTGSVASIKSDDLRAPVLQFYQAIQGRATGVFVSNNQAQPGGNVTVRIRGTNSINGGNEPLYVVDGVIGGGAVNPSDIETIDILKDASSTAIYGSRGANGVIIITTKTGKKGKNTVSFDAYYGIQSVSKKLDLMNAREYAGFVNALDVSKGNTPTYPNIDNLTIDTDWQDQIFHLAPMQDYKISSTGGTDKLNYYISGGYTQQDGVIIESGYNRYNLRLNLDSEVSGWFKIGTRIGVSRVRRNQEQSEIQSEAQTNHPLAIALELPPTISPYDESGNLLTKIIDGQNLGRSNPAQFLKNVDNHNFASVIDGNIFSEFKILKELQFRSTFNLQINDSKTNRFKPSYVYSFDKEYMNTASISTSFTKVWLNENYFTFNKQFDQHKLQVIGGFTAQKTYTESLGASVENFALDDFEYHYLSAASVIGTPSSGLSERSNASFFGRIHYTLKDKYLVTFNSRYDGFSGFGNNKKWGFFPSAAAAWRISEEPFFKNQTLVSNLKLRGSYGISGSEALGPYNSFAQVKSSSIVLGGQKVVAAIPSKMSNANLSWEQTSQLDAGVDASFFDGRVNMVADYYHKKTTDLFLTRPVPQTTGFSSSLQNIGSLKNQGVELGIDALIVNTSLKWNMTFNLSRSWSKVLDLGLDPNENGDQEIILGDVTGNLKLGNMQIIRTGEPFGSFYGYKTNGIWQKDDVSDEYKQFGSVVNAGDFKYIDQNNDKDITDADRVIIGRSQPMFFGGFNNTFNWKNWEASVFMQYAVGMDVLNVSRMVLMNMGTKNNHLKEALNYWTENNTNTTIPRIGYSVSGVIVDQYLEDASFLRISEITIGYSLPRLKLNTLHIERLRFYLTGSNLFTITGYSGYDPEVNIYGSSASMLNMDNGSFPRAKSITVGMNITF